MKRAEILALVNRGALDTALPRVVTDKRVIIAVGKSQCCHAPAMLVRSRAGGFVSQDCLKCGLRSDYVRPNDIPDLDCEGCRKFRSNTVVPIIKDTIYWYECTGCRRAWSIPSLIPAWSEAFGYAGLAAPRDAASSGR